MASGLGKMHISEDRKPFGSVMRIMLVGLMTIVISSSCTGFTRRLNPTPSHTITALPNPTPISTIITASTNTEPPILNGVPKPSLFDTEWLDRSKFVSGLVPVARNTLDDRFDRSVYHLAVDIADNFQSIEIHEELLYTNHEDTVLDKIILRMYPPLFGAKVKYNEFMINGQESQAQILYQASVLQFNLEHGLGVGESIVISIKLEMEMPEDPSGNYQIFGYVNDLLTLAHFYPMAAVYDESGWHTEIPPPYGDVTYTDSSYYLVQVNLPQNATVVSSGNIISKEFANQQQTFTIAGGPMRDFYLAAGTNMEVYTRQIGDTRVNSYAPVALREGSVTANDVAFAAIDIFSREIGLYPYTEFDVLATYTNALGVEYPGITAINQNLYKGGQDLSGTPNQVYLESTVAHEVGHQWFYGVVGNDQVNQPWLDESLTQYITGLYFTERYGPQVSKEYQSSWFSRWDRVQEETTPIGLPVSDYDQKAYSAIVYGRGPIFFSVLEKEIGETAFASFLRSYYSANLWENSNSQQITKIAEEACSCDLTQLFDEWVKP